jgi:hypothetical protein
MRELLEKIYVYVGFACLVALIGWAIVASAADKSARHYDDGDRYIYRR